MGGAEDSDDKRHHARPRLAATTGEHCLRCVTFHPALLCGDTDWTLPATLRAPCYIRFDSDPPHEPVARVCLQHSDAELDDRGEVLCTACGWHPDPDPDDSKSLCVNEPLLHQHLLQTARDAEAPGRPATTSSARHGRAPTARPDLLARSPAGRRGRPAGRRTGSFRRRRADLVPRTLICDRSATVFPTTDGTARTSRPAPCPSPRTRRWAARPPGRRGHRHPPKHPPRRPLPRPAPADPSGRRADRPGTGGRPCCQTVDPAARAQRSRSSAWSPEGGGDWLDPRALYRAHEQTVRLVFDDDPAPGEPS